VTGKLRGLLQNLDLLLIERTNVAPPAPPSCASEEPGKSNPVIFAAHVEKPRVFGALQGKTKSKQFCRTPPLYGLLVFALFGFAF
jgi:hypothetical protein